MRIPALRKKLQIRQPTNQIGRPRTAFSYYAGDAPRKQDSVRARARNEQRLNIFRRLRLLPTVIALLAIAISVVYSTTLSTVPSLKYTGDASPYHSKNVYRHGIEQDLNSSLWNRSKLTINTKNVEKEIIKSFPEFDIVTVSLPVVGRRPTVTIHVRQPALLLASSGNVFVVDRSGKVVAEAADLMSSKREKLILVQDQSGLVIKVGSQALTTDTVSFILNMLAQFQHKKLVIASVTLPAIPNQVDVRIKDTNYYIKTDSSGDARLQVGAYLAARNNGISPVEYVDVRVEEKVFYK